MGVAQYPYTWASPLAEWDVGDASPQFRILRGVTRKSLLLKKIF